MARTSSASPTAEDLSTEAVEQRVLGERLRVGRQKHSLSLRELARRIGVSASLISQVENGRVRPSVSTLLALVTELELSLDNLFSPDSGEATSNRREPEPVASKPNAIWNTLNGIGPSQVLELAGLLPQTTTTWSKASAPQAAGPWSPLGVGRAGSRASLELESGVRWERLTPYSVPGMEFLYVRYEVGASSTAAGKHTRHQGIEFGYVTSGSLHITVGFDEVACDPGSSVMFDAATPHRLENRGDIPAEAVWLIIGRHTIGVSAGS